MVVVKVTCIRRFVRGDIEGFQGRGNMIVKDLMSAVSFSVPKTGSISAIVSIMQAHQYPCVMVCEDGIPIGMITEADIVKVFGFALNKTAIDALTAEDIMHPEPVCVSETSRMEEALVLAKRHGAKHLPVVVDSSQRLVGLVTQADLLNAYLNLLERESELENRNQELQLLCLEDPLLGIGNRRALEVDMSFTRAACKRHQRAYSVVLFDIDYFKQYNDIYGHIAGDDALVKVVTGIVGSMRTSDRLYRFGGEEILMLMPDTEAAGALIGAERAKAALAVLEIPHEASETGFLTVSAGVASSEVGGEGHLVKLADDALYLAKEAGRNCIMANNSETS